VIATHRRIVLFLVLLSGMAAPGVPSLARQAGAGGGEVRDVDGVTRDLFRPAG
jgi:hypothetical protein